MKSSLLALVLVLVFAAPALAANECYSAGVGATHYWTLNETSGTNAWDWCGGNNLTHAGTYTSGDTGIYDLAVNFTTNNGGYSLTNTLNFVDADDDWTITFWVKPLGVAPATSYYYINEPSNGYWRCAMWSGSALLRCDVWAGAQVNTFSDVALVAGNWYFVAFVYDEGTAITLYVNGTTANDTAAIGTISTGAGLRLSGSLAGYGSYAVTDEVRFFNYTLNTTAIGNLFQYNSISAPTSTGGTSVSITSPSASAVDDNLTVNFQPITTYPGDSWSSCTLYANSSNAGTNAVITNGSANYITNDTLAGEGYYSLSVSCLNSTSVATVSVSQAFYLASTLPVPNFTIANTAPYMVFNTIQFNDTSNYGIWVPGSYLNQSSYRWNFNDTNLSTTRNATNVFTAPGYYYVCLGVNNSVNMSSAADSCQNITINGLALDVFDEKTLAAIGSWNVTFANSTYSQSFSNQANTFTWNNYTNFPVGALTISISAAGYVGRTYYGVFNIGSYINLNAFLLDSASGIYPVFIVKNEQDVVIQGAILTFMKSIGSAYVTVAQATTDVTGTTQVYLDPTVVYYLTVSATNYNTYTTSSFQPVSTTYVITLTQNSTFNFSSAEGFLYMRIGPDIPTVGNKTMMQFICNDPWSNVQDFSIEIINSTNQQAYYANSSASASCGILEVNLSSIMTNMTTFTRFTVVGRILRNGENFTIYRDYGLQGSWASGLAKEMSEWAGRDANDPFTFNKTGDAVITKGTANILSFIVVAAATLGASITFGFGAGIIGIAVGGFLVYMGWLMWELWLLAFVLCLLVYASKGVVR